MAHLHMAVMEPGACDQMAGSVKAGHVHGTAS